MRLDPLFAWRVGNASLTAAASALAALGALNVVLGCFGGAERNHLWVQGGSGAGLLPTLGIVAFACGRFGGSGLGRARTALHAGGAWLLAGLCLLDAVGYARLRGTGAIASPLAFSLSLAIAVLLLWAGATGPVVPPTGGWRRVGRVALTGGAGAALLLAHVLTFGATDYRSPADVAVVFGSAVRPDGTPSGSLLDRTVTACDLYRRGLVRRLVLSGGRDPAVPMSEPDCMARIALAQGLPHEALVLDETGVTSEATLATLVRLNVAHGWRRALLVSHDYHLARLALLAEAHGLSARTVPAVETRPWPHKHRFVLRELAAFAWHYLRTVG